MRLSPNRLCRKGFWQHLVSGPELPRDGAREAWAHPAPPSLYPRAHGRQGLLPPPAHQPLGCAHGWAHLFGVLCWFQGLGVDGPYRYLPAFERSLPHVPQVLACAQGQGGAGGMSLALNPFALPPGHGSTAGDVSKYCGHLLIFD